MLTRAMRFLSGTRSPWLLGLLACALSLPALRLGFQADDYIVRWQVEHGAEPWRLFRASPEMIAEGRETGALAWWTSPQLEIEFFRPVTSLMHAAELTLWPDTPVWMLLINILVYGACVVIAARLYRKLAPTVLIASLAGLMFAIDDAHAQSVGWISGRNTLLALLGALLALAFHVAARERVRARSSGALGYALASTLAVMFALGSAEAGVWSLSFVIAYAFALEDGALLARIRSIAPQLAVGVLWAAFYAASGFGLKGSSLYRSVSAPLQALGQGVLDLPLWTTSLLGPSLIGAGILVPESTARLAALPIALVMLWLTLPALRRSRECRFFALATALSLLPLMMTLASDRVLLGTSFAAFGWIACAIADGFAHSGNTPSARQRWTARVLIFVHVALALLLYVPMLRTVHRFESGRRAITEVIAPGRDMILIATPIELLSNYVGAALQRVKDPPPIPRSLHALYSGGSELWLERTSANSLDVTATRGWGYTPVERIFCNVEDMPKAGDEVRFQRMTVRVLENNARGMPQKVRFELPTPLESAERVWLTWQGDHPVRWTPPAIGQRVRIAPLDMLKAMPQ